MTPLAVVLACALASPATGDAEAATDADAAEPAARVRVFFAQIQTGQGTTEEEVALVQDAVLVAAREHSPGYEVLAVGDVAGLLAAEAEAAATGCDAVSCASELADALNAPQLVTGQLGRLGDTWLLTLTRLDRDTLEVLAREQIKARGDAPDVLLDALPVGVGRLFGAEVAAPALPWLTLAGAGVMGVGVVALGVGAAAQGLAWFDAEQARNADTNAEYNRIRERGPAWVSLSVGAYVTGGVALLLGGGVLGAGLLLDGGTE